MVAHCVFSSWVPLLSGPLAGFLLGRAWDLHQGGSAGVSVVGSLCVYLEVGEGFKL